MAKSLQRKLYELYRNGVLTKNDIDRLVIIPNNASESEVKDDTGKSERN